MAAAWAAVERAEALEAVEDSVASWGANLDSDWAVADSAVDSDWAVEG